MRIKKLEIFGFKSFKDRTVIQFDEGITGIVGPNGCGKSNIVDALIWVMGEMSAKHLRGASMEDVIFAGAEGYAPMGMAEVSLTLENDGGPFPAQYARFSEVMVTRRLNRSGESEYFINKEPARLRDIQEIFMDTGAGSKGFSIIEQGAIGKIITSKPEDRRVLIEEAAGITKFKVRKRESQRKLDSTEQNLLRLQDIIGEQKRQIDSLERQAQRAERYRKIKNELQEKDLWLASQNYLNYHQEATEAETHFIEARDLDAGSEGRLSALESRLAALRLDLTQRESDVQTEQLAHRESMTRVQDTEFRIRELNMAIEQARRSNDMTGSMVSQYSLRKENLTSELERIDSDLTEARENLIRLEDEFATKNAVYQATQENIQKCDMELTDKRREMLTVSTGQNHLESRELVLKTKLEGLLKQKDQLTAVVSELQAKKNDFTERRNRLFADLEKERQMQMDLTKDVDLIAQNLSGVKSSLLAKKDEQDELKDELNQVASRLYGLENLQSNFEGFEDGVKNVLLWQRTKNEEGQKFQPLSECVEVSPRFELAMEAALGTRLQMLMSPTTDEAMGALDYLKTQGRGRSSFLSGDMAIVESNPQEHERFQLKMEAGFEGFLNESVTVPAAMSSQVQPFLSDVVVVDKVRTALRLRPNFPRFTYVTLEGDVVGRDGVLTGGAADSADSGVLKRRREIKELSLSREELAGKLALISLAVQKLAEQEAGLMRDLEKAKQNAVEKEMAITELRKDLERAETELESATRSLERENNNFATIDRDYDEMNRSLVDLTTQIEEMRTKKVMLETRVQELTVELATAREGIEDKNKEVTDLKVKVAETRQTSESLERERMVIDSTLSDITSQLTRMTEESEKNTNTLTVSQVEVENRQVELQRLIHQVKELEGKVASARNIYEEAHALVRSIEEELSRSMHEINSTKNRMNEAQLKLEQLKMKETYLVGQIFERYQLHLPEVAPNHRDLPGDVEQFTRDVEELRDKIKKIGEVNLSAIQEYDDVIKRYEFLNQQHTDLIEAQSHLRKVIDRINRICSRRFKETFEQVNERFQKVFPVLFGGGEAMLLLVDGKEGEDPGIDIVSRPPGKKLQNVTLLSGGEKALTAVSLIFSIFLVKPSPFCLLDEVDAPLDDANVMRFNDLVKEMARRSQIIIVTHNKHTMKVNNKLYGVTMQEKGVSKMVSVSLADAERIATA